jgi:lysozyme
VSNHQGNINWQAVKDSGVQFAYMKATEGDFYVDPYFPGNRKGAQDAGLKVGYYHYFHPEESVDAQVKLFCDKVGKAEPNSLRLEIDAEDPSNWRQFTPEQRVQKIVDFCEGVKKTLGITPELIIYANPSFVNDLLKNSSTLKNYPLFIANYGVDQPNVPNPWDKWDFWQYSESGRVPGINGNVDMDLFNGTADDLTKYQNSVRASEIK